MYIDPSIFKIHYISIYALHIYYMGAGNATQQPAQEGAVLSTRDAARPLNSTRLSLYTLIHT